MRLERTKLVITKLFPLVFPYILGVILVLGLFSLSKQMTMAKNNVQTPRHIDLTPPADLETVKGKKSDPIDVSVLATATPESVASGKETFNKMCVSCHGAGGKGDGVAGKALVPPPRNLTQSQGWKNGRHIDQMFTTLTQGVPGSAMAAYDSLSIQERFNVIHYIQTLASDYPPASATDIQSIDAKFNLSKGVDTPNQIPVAKAMEKLASEAKKD